MASKRKDLRVTIVQSNLYWEDIDRNITSFSKKLDSIKEKTDLIVLPETFTTGFTMNAVKNSEDMEGKAVRFLKSYSKKINSYICGSVIIKENNKFYNRLLVASPQGVIKYYDKKHLFSMAKEDNIFTPGNKQLILKIKKWNIAFFICYDLRFPVWCRNKNNYDAGVFVANWPSRRNYHWKSLLLARAIENQSYVIGVNRIGKDGNKIDCKGDSAVINPLGKYLIDAKSKNKIFSTNLDYELLVNYRKRFPIYGDSDKFKIL